MSSAASMNTATGSYLGYSSSGAVTCVPTGSFLGAYQIAWQKGISHAGEISTVKQTFANALRELQSQRKSVEEGNGKVQSLITKLHRNIKIENTSINSFMIVTTINAKLISLAREIGIINGLLAKSTDCGMQGGSSHKIKPPKHHKHETENKQSAERKSHTPPKPKPAAEFLSFANFHQLKNADDDISSTAATALSKTAPLTQRTLTRAQSTSALSDARSDSSFGPNIYAALPPSTAVNIDQNEVETILSQIQSPNDPKFMQVLHIAKSSLELAVNSAGDAHSLIFMLTEITRIAQNAQDKIAQMNSTQVNG